MIFVSIALLVVAAVSLGIGIVSSSVPPLVVSIIATLAAAGTLWASFIRYRNEAAEQGLQVVGLGGNQPRNPGYPESYGGNTMAQPVAVGAAPVAHATTASAVPAGWDDLDESRATSFVSAFNLEELHELRRHEVEHGYRPSVVAEIDQRISTIVDLRRSAVPAASQRPLKAR